MTPRRLSDHELEDLQAIAVRAREVGIRVFSARVGRSARVELPLDLLQRLIAEVEVRRMQDHHRNKEWSP